MGTHVSSVLAWWARRDLNASYQHPKLEGYQATPRARKERDRRRGASIGSHLIDQVCMRQYHPPAAVPLETQCVENLLGRFTHIGSPNELLKRATYYFAASEASNWDYHSITCRTSDASSLRLFRAASSGASFSDRIRAETGRISNRAPAGPRPRGTVQAPSLWPSWWQPPGP